MEMLSLIPDFVIDALKDSLNLVPFLFVIFVFIEVFEYYFSDKIKDFMKCSKNIGPIIGAISAIVPQCGFSVLASTLYIKKFISVGTLLSVYIATSDEAIPVLLASPTHFKSMTEIILIKVVIAIFVGYVVDYILEKIFHKNIKENTDITDEPIEDKGCCGHIITEKKRERFIWHPLKHTFNIFIFILLVCLILNYSFSLFGFENIQNHMLQNSFWQPVITAIIGLIPNCAVSIVIAVMFLNGIISLGSTVAGLSSSAGLGLLVLIRKNSSFKNTMFIILTLLMVSIISGIAIQKISAFI